MKEQTESMSRQPNWDLISTPEQTLTPAVDTIGASRVAYNELADVPVQEIDPVALVQKNLAHLQEQQSRMNFLMREVRYLLKV